MTKAKITPGLWKAASNHGCRSITAKSSFAGQRHKQARRVEIACTVGMYDDAEDAANAKAMAAVPQMIEALLAARADAVGNDNGYRHCNLCNTTCYEGGERHVDGCPVPRMDEALKAAGVL